VGRTILLPSSAIIERIFGGAGTMTKNIDYSSSQKNPFRHKFCLIKGTCTGKEGIL
jgi:hypothetical protein